LCSAAQFISLIVKNVAKKNLGPKKDVRVEWKNLLNEELRAAYYDWHQI